MTKFQKALLGLIALGFALTIWVYLENRKEIKETAKFVSQSIDVQDRMRLKPGESDSVTVEMIRTLPWKLDVKAHVDNTPDHKWKVKSGKWVVIFNYMPNTVFFKWDEGESVDNQTMLSLMHHDWTHHEPYSLHIARQSL